MKSIVGLLIFALAASAVSAGSATVSSSGAGVGATGTKGRVFFGGGVGLGLGDVTYIDVAPLVGYHFAPRLRAGVSFLYRYRKDDRYGDGISTNDWGASVFAQYSLTKSIFAHGEVEYLNYEFLYSDLTTDRDGFTSLFGGFGFSHPIGGRASVFALALYNFSYDSSEIPRPYDGPVILRVGVGFGF